MLSEDMDVNHYQNQLHDLGVCLYLCHPKRKSTSSIFKRFFTFVFRFYASESIIGIKLISKLIKIKRDNWSHFIDYSVKT